MDKQKAYKNVLENFFLERTITFEGLKEIVASVGPVFGKLEVREEVMEDGQRKYIFIDNDVYDTVMYPDGKTEAKETDMSTVILRLNIDVENVITIVEHGMSIFTPANKDKVLVASSLIGKKVEF